MVYIYQMKLYQSHQVVWCYSYAASIHSGAVDKELIFYDIGYGYALISYFVGFIAYFIIPLSFQTE